jgi:hypothetical protein
MWKFILITLFFFSSVLVYSCIFNDDSLEPNQSPQIISFSPEWNIATLQVPADSAIFGIEAVDAEDDPIRYSFVINN